MSFSIWSDYNINMSILYVFFFGIANRSLRKLVTWKKIIFHFVQKKLRRRFLLKSWKMILIIQACLPWVHIYVNIYDIWYSHIKNLIPGVTKHGSHYTNTSIDPQRTSGANFRDLPSLSLDTEWSYREPHRSAPFQHEVMHIKRPY